MSISLPDFLSDTTLVFWSVFAFVLLVMWLFARSRRRKKSEQIERDPSGLWKYHKDTHYRRKRAYRSALEAEAAESNGKKKKKKKDKSSEDEKKKLVIALSFDGDLRAKQHNALARMVDEIVLNKDKIEEVVIRITSPGGTVPQYGHAYSELERVRELGITLTACVDVVAASGGYLMSLPANRIIAAPFAMVGSVGVMAFVPNIRRLLVKHDIDPRMFYAGNLKRTVGLVDQASPEEQAHFQSQLDAIHELFRSSVVKYRPAAKIEQITTGDHWTAAESMEKELGLVDQLGTSSDYLLQRNAERDVVYLEVKRSVWEERFGALTSRLYDQIESRLFGYPLGL